MVLTKRIANHIKIRIIDDFVLQVCDEPHPLLIKDMLDHCIKADIDEAYKAGVQGAISIIFNFLGNIPVLLWILKNSLYVDVYVFQFNSRVMSFEKAIFMKKFGSSLDVL